MRQLEVGGTALHVVASGPADGPALVLLHALGTDLRVWDGVVARLPAGLRVARLDMRGHGLSDAPPGPYGMGALVADAEGAMDALGLAVKRGDLVRGLVLSNTGAKIGTAAIWHERIAAARAGGLEALADATLARWFPEPFRSGGEAALMRRMLVRTPLEGWAGCAAAIAGADFFATTAGLRLPVLGIAGDRDGSTPPDLVRETVAHVPGGRTQLIRGAGHLPCIDAPDAYAAALTGFLREIGHLPA